MGNKNNRFMNPEMASKNRIQPPSKILHFFNTPPGLEEHEVEKLFVENGAPPPKCVKMFPSKTDRSSSGLIEFVNQVSMQENFFRLRRGCGNKIRCWDFNPLPAFSANMRLV